MYEFCLLNNLANWSRKLKQIIDSEIIVIIISTFNLAALFPLNKVVQVQMTEMHSQSTVSTVPLHSLPTNGISVLSVQDVTERVATVFNDTVTRFHVFLFNLSFNYVITSIHSEKRLSKRTSGLLAGCKFRILLRSYLGHLDKLFRLSTFTSFPFITLRVLCKLVKRSRKINCPTVAISLYGNVSN